MISSPQLKANFSHPLSRFVSVEALALFLNIPVEAIYHVSCWRYVIHVVGEGISTFVSYADLPPILEVNVPERRDFSYWRKRWRKNKINRGKAPEFWQEFYLRKCQTAQSILEVEAWYKLIMSIAFAFTPNTLETLQQVYKKSPYILDAAAFLLLDETYN